MCYIFSIQKIARFDISCLWTTKHNPSFKTSPQNMFLLIHVSFNFFFSILLHMTEKAENTRSSWGENKTDLFCFGQTFHKRNLLLLWKPTQIASGHLLFGAITHYFCARVPLSSLSSFFLTLPVCCVMLSFCSLKQFSAQWLDQNCKGHQK